jgi:hypothetical protein
MKECGRNRSGDGVRLRPKEEVEKGRTSKESQGDE